MTNKKRNENDVYVKSVLNVNLFHFEKNYFANLREDLISRTISCRVCTFKWCFIRKRYACDIFVKSSRKIDGYFLENDNNDTLTLCITSITLQVQSNKIWGDVQYGISFPKWIVLLDDKLRIQ